MSISSVNGVASTVSRYRFVAAGGETSLSGTDANGATLSYLIGKEEVYLNGALLVRGQDYTGTDGATISSLTALVAGDTVEIITFVPFAIPTAISSSTVTTQGDLIVATGASAVTRLGVGSSGTILTSNGTTPAYTSTITGTLNNGTLTGTLTAASTSGTSGQFLSSTGTGVQWSTPAAGSLTLLNGPSGTTLSGSSVQVTGISQSYKSLYIVWGGITNASDDHYQILPNNNNSLAWYGSVDSSGTASGQTSYYISFDTTNFISGSGGHNLQTITINNYASTTQFKTFYGNGYWYGSSNNANMLGGGLNTTSAITSLTFKAAAGSMTGGTALIYGVN